MRGIEMYSHHTFRPPQSPNLIAICTALAAAGIVKLQAYYHVSNDEGHVGAISALDKDNKAISIPAVDVTVHYAGSTQTAKLADALDEEVYQQIHNRHGGFEINRGSNVTFELDVVSHNINVHQRAKPIRARLRR
jgi:hypothetical protein